MSLPTGKAEQAIRAAAEARARQLWPDARIVHELNVENGSRRADMAVVAEDKLILIELKSERDTLDRLPDQIAQFEKVAHHVIVVADKKWCEPPAWSKDKDGRPFLDWPSIWAKSAGATVWQYADGECKGELPWRGHEWPWTARMLNLLWRDELEAACLALDIAVKKRANRWSMIGRLMRERTASVLEKAVLEQLRTRPFATDDARAAMEKAEQ